MKEAGTSQETSKTINPGSASISQHSFQFIEDPIMDRTVDDMYARFKTQV